ncbi:MAG: hypothetical protein E6Q97_15180 [Desulfurellales bacterium]|nr:MAG: hypothetical protein E6Q97_15180 [Desulfurellales bacterium]
MIPVNSSRRAFLRPVVSMTMDQQRALAVKSGCGAIYAWGKSSDRVNPRERWIASLEPGDVAWVADLRCLLLPKPPRKVRPVIDFSLTVERIRATGAVIVDAVAGISSDDKKRWPEHYKRALERVANGERALRRKLAKARARSRKPANAGKGIVALWRSPAMAAERDRCLDIWCNVKRYGTAEAAQAAMPFDDLRRASLLTLRRIFDSRYPAGKRGRKRST